MVVLTFFRSQVWPVLVWAWGICTALTLAMRAIPEGPFVRFEKAYPRLGRVARAVRKFGTDLVPFVRDVLNAFRGVPLPAILFAVMLAPAFGCRWQRPDPQCPGRAREQRCRNGIPSECDSAGYWMPLQDRCSDRALECRDRVPGARVGEFYSACVRPDSTRGGVQETPEPDAGASDGGAP